MTIHEAYSKLLDELCSIYDAREAANIAGWVFENVTGHKKVDRLLNKHSQLKSGHETTLDNYTNQLLQHRPVQYVLHEAWFAGLKLYVDESVLIPRPETEELVEWIVDENSKFKIQNSKFSILDVGTGSGCIPLALKSKLPEAIISAVDISEDALNVARKNASANSLDVHFLKLDFLDKQQWKSLDKYDIIVSNPPYIKQSEAGTMSDNVLKYEPQIALFVPDNDALIFYRVLAEFAQTHLNEAGSLFVEINEQLGQQVVDLFKEYNLKKIELRKDLQGKERMVRATKNS